jgi:hypothetical protein
MRRTAAMRRATALATLAFAALPACTSSNTLHPTITELRNGSVSVSPLPVCTGVAAFPVGQPNSATPALSLIGSEFVPNVDLVSDNPVVSYGTAQFIGPATINAVISFVSAQELSVGARQTQSVVGQPLVPPGAYDFVFVDSDLGVFRRAHAVDFVLPPQVTGLQPSSICPDRDETVTISGSGFTPGPTSITIPTSFGPPGPEFPATATADSVIATIPAGTVRPSGFSSFVVKDPSGCISSTFMVNTTAACGP